MVKWRKSGHAVDVAWPIKAQEAASRLTDERGLEDTLSSEKTLTEHLSDQILFDITTRWTD